MNAALCELGNILIWVVWLYTIALLIYAVFSWVPDLRGGGFERFLGAIIEPLLIPLRRIVPPLGGLDIAFLILLLVLQFIARPLITNATLHVCALN